MGYAAARLAGLPFTPLSLPSPPFPPPLPQLLAPLLPRLTGLTALALASNGIKSEGARSLGAALSNLTGLQVRGGEGREW